ncbi:uncharacterized protein [Paramisgurnus dabryanus]|uniref:uncharacterized protein isoform X2 n=1 Tax=Paramisgurnus dabryanus TaxID=90735 RepID=UPI0031F467D4
MEVLQHSYLQLLNILLLTLLELKAVTQTPCKNVNAGSINSAQGDNVSIYCNTTTLHSNTFNVKLRRTNPDEIVLQYPNAASQLHRWSVRTDAGHVRLDLQNITLSDSGRYECEVHSGLECTTTKLSLRVKECKVMDPIWTTEKSTVTLPCSEHLNVEWEVIHGDQSTDVNEYSCKHSDSIDSAPKPLCERQITKNGSLIIRDVVNTDAQWYRCRVNKMCCYDVRLHVTGHKTSDSTTAVQVTVSTVSLAVQSEGKGSSTAAISIVSLCVIITLIVFGILYLKKRKSKTSRQIEFNRNSLYFLQDSVYYSQISDGLQFPLYYLLDNNTDAMTTFVPEQTEATAYGNVDQPVTKCSC